MKKYRTDFLFPKDEFIIGLGSVFNIAGNYYLINYSKDADVKALASDWGVVGNDIEIISKKEKKSIDNPVFSVQK